MRGDVRPDAHLVVSDLAVLQRALQRAEGYSVGLRSTAALGVLEGHYVLHVFDQIAAHAADDLEEVVWVVVVADPQRDVLVAERILAELLELADLSLCELRQETAIVGPEQANIRNLEQLHRKPLEPQPSCPAPMLRSSTLLQHKIVDHSAAQHLHPLVIIKDLELEGRVREGKVSVDPSLIALAE